MKAFIGLILFSWFSLGAHGSDFTSLNGFKLWQLKEAVANSLGQPFETFDREHAILEAHGLSPNGYMVFEYFKHRPHHVASIQITGEVDNMLPLQGFRLGDPAADFIKVFGEPDQRTQIPSPKVEVFYYDQLNGSFEFDEKGRLYSIRINVTEEMMTNLGEDEAFWLKFKSALLSKDVETLLEFMRPDVEFYKGDTILRINRRFADFLADPDPEFIDTLIGGDQSLLSAVQQSDPEQDVRLVENTGVGFVMKFHDGDIVKEVFFLPYAGDLKVYEVDFYGSNIGGELIPSDQ